MIRRINSNRAAWSTATEISIVALAAFVGAERMLTQYAADLAWWRWWRRQRTVSQWSWLVHEELKRLVLESSARSTVGEPSSAGAHP